MKPHPIPFKMFSPGKRWDDVTNVDDTEFVKYEELSALDCHMTAEILSTGHISLCIEHDEGDYDMIICANGPDVPLKISEMLLRFDTKQFKKWLVDRQNE